MLITVKLLQEANVLEEFIMCLIFRFVQYLILGWVCSGCVIADTKIESSITWLDKFLGLSSSLYEPQFSKTSPFNATIYKVGIHPLHNPKRLFEVYAPLIDLFNAQIPEATFILEASKNYDDFDKKLYAQHFDFALPNPYQTINALKHNYHVFAKMGDDENFRGLILVRTDSHINQLSDLKGKIVAYPARTALAATLMPQYYLQTHGLNINTDIENIYVGSQESSIMNVLNRKVIAGATWPVPWKAFVKNEPKLAQQLEVKWQTESLLNNSWMARQNIPADMIEKIRFVLLHLPETTEGQKILDSIPISKFEVANDATYKPIETFVTNFNATVRPLN